MINAGDKTANEKGHSINEELEATHRATAACHYVEAIVRTTPDPLLILNSELRIYTANEAFYGTFRLSAAETRGRLIYELGNRQWDTPKLRELLEGILPRKGFFDFDVTDEVNNVCRRTMLLNARALTMTPEQPAFILLGIQDVTELLHFQAETRRSEQRYRQLFEAAKDGVLIMDLTTRKILDANPFIAELLGYTHQELLGKELYEIGLLKDEAANLAAFRELRKEGFIRYENLPLESGAGERRYVEIACNLYQEDEEQIIPCTVHDNTEKKRAEAQVQESEECYRTLVEQVKDYAIFRMNAEGVTTTWNEGVRQVLGFEEAEFIGRDIVSSIVTPEDIQSGVARGKLDQAASEGAARDDCWMMRKDGTRFFAVGITTALRNEAGTLLGFTKVVRDQTERKRLEEQLRRYAADLSDGDRRKNQFLALLGHELRNFLAPIRNGVQLLRMTCGDEQAVQTASEMMERQVGQMVRLVDDLLDISRVSQCKIELRRERIELASAVNHAVEAVRSNVQCMDQELSVTFPPQPLYLNADPTRLAQVIVNLLNNACKFTDKTGRISLVVEREGEQAVIRVRDTGIGIAADQLPRIFDMFMQVDTSLNRTASGLGIGLPLVKSLVEMHDGTLEAHSEGLGQGSEFVVRLPILVETPNLPRPVTTVGEPTTTPHRHILVVDDNRDSAKSLAMLLKMAGHETHIAHDGVEAVEAAETLRPEIILLDIGLPRLNGYDACQKIREQQWGKRMAIVALTGWCQEEDRQKSRDAGFDGHLVKPVDLATLKKLVDNC